MLSATSGAGVLSTYTHTPPVTQTTMRTDLLQTLNIITQLSIEVLREYLTVLSGLEVLLTIEEPHRDLELLGGLDDCNKLLDLIGSEFSGAFVHIDFGLLADQIGETATDTLDLGNGKNYITLSLYVGVENTQNVLEFWALH